MDKQPEKTLFKRRHINVKVIYEMVLNITDRQGNAD